MEGQLRSRMDFWVRQATPTPGGARLGYRTERDAVTKGLLQRTGMGAWDDFTCLGSLRDVEPSVGLVLDDRIMDDGYASTSTGSKT